MKNAQHPAAAASITITTVAAAAWLLKRTASRAMRATICDGPARASAANDAPCHAVGRVSHRATQRLSTWGIGIRPIPQERRSAPAPLKHGPVLFLTGRRAVVAGYNGRGPSGHDFVGAAGEIKPRQSPGVGPED